MRGSGVVDEGLRMGTVGVVDEGLRMGQWEW